MIKIIKKALFFLLISLITLFSGYFIYKSYIAYQKYQITKESEKYTLFIKKIDRSLIKIEQENSLSALYLGTKGALDFNKLKKLREKTDNSIKDIVAFIKNNPEFSLYNKSIENIPKNLQYVRSRVDVLSPDYKDIFFTYYQDEIFNSLLNIIKNSANNLSMGVENLKKHLYLYVEFINFRNNIEKEKSFISLIITLRKKMDRSDLIVWDKMIAQDIIPNFDKLDSKTIETIKAKLKTKNFLKLGFDIRVDIAKKANVGYYSTDINSWLKSMDEKRKRVKQSEQIIFKYLKDKTTNIEFSPKEIILYIFFALFLIFLLISLLFTKKSKKNKKIVIKDIPIDDRREINDRRAVNRHISHSNNLFETNLNLNEKKETSIQISHTPIKTDNKLKTEINKINTFNALKEFNSIVEFFAKTIKKDITLKYQIDPSIPTSCVGDFSKIKQILENIIKYAINNTKAYNGVEIYIDTSAENKKESAVNFKITAPNCYINKKQKQIIMRAFYQKNIPLSNQMRSDLILTSKLISSIDGVFGIDSDLKKGTIFLFTLSIKKSIS